MIQFPARLIELLQQPVHNIFYCIRLKNLRFTTYNTDITLADGVYAKNSFVVGLDTPRLDSIIDRDLYKITITDSDFSMGNLYETSLIGASVAVYVLFVDNNTGIPETSADGVFMIYYGIVESFNYEIDTSEKGSVTSVISCANPMADLDSVDPFYTSKDFIKGLDVNDTAFDQVYEGSGPIQLKWGKG